MLGEKRVGGGGKQIKIGHLGHEIPDDHALSARKCDSILRYAESKQPVSDVQALSQPGPGGLAASGSGNRGQHESARSRRSQQAGASASPKEPKLGIASDIEEDQWRQSQEPAGVGASQ